MHPIRQPLVLWGFITLLGVASLRSQAITQGTPVTIGPGVLQTWTPFTIISLQPNYWNCVGVSSSIDYDLRVAGTSSTFASSLCDFVVADANSGTPTRTPSEWRRWASSSTLGTLQHAANSFLVGRGTITLSSAAGSVIRSLDFQPTVPGVHSIALTAPTSTTWHLYRPSGTATWQSRSSATYSGGVGTGSFTVLPNHVGQWHAVVLAKDNGPSLGSPSLTITPPVSLPDLQPTALSGPSGFVGTGLTSSLSYTIVNNTATSVGTFAAKIYLSSDITITTGDCEVATLTLTGISGNGTLNGSVTVTTPLTCSGSCSTGLRYWGIVVDPAGQVSEVNENNNTRAGNTCTLWNRGSFLVTGSAMYDDRPFSINGLGTAVPRPIAGAEVQVREVNGTSTTAIAFGATNASGYFSILIPDNIDPQSGPRDIVVWIITSTPNGRVEVRNPVTPYELWHTASLVTIDHSGCNLSVGTVNPPGVPGSSPGLMTYDGLWSIFETLLMGYNYVDALPSTGSPGRVAAYWDIGYILSRGSYYDPITGIIHLHGGGDCTEFNDAVLLHEYGHAMYHQFRGLLCQGGEHAFDWNWPAQYQPWYRLTCQQARSLVWNESWAHVFSGAVRGQGYYLSLDVYGGPRFPFDFESPGQLHGADCEGAVTSILWDLYDPANEPHDALALGFPPLWAIATNSSLFAACDLRDFWNTWFGTGMGSRDAVYRVFADRDVHYIPALATNPLTLGFGTLTGLPASLPVSIVLNGNGSANWLAASPAAWLSENPSGGLLTLPTGTPASSCAANNGGPVSALSMITANPAGLVAGIYQGLVTVSTTSTLPGGVAFSPLTLPATMTYTPPSCTMSISPAAAVVTTVAGGVAGQRQFALQLCGQAGPGIWSFVPGPGWSAGLTYPLQVGTCTANFLPQASSVTPAGLYSGILRWDGNCNGNFGTALQASVIVDVRPRLQMATPCPLPQGMVQTTYSTTLTASGGIPPYVWSLDGTSLPPGLSLLSARVSGIPTLSGLYHFRTRVDDSVGTSIQVPCSVFINCESPSYFGTACGGVCVPQIGINGGAPCPGNTTFEVTLSNVPASVSAFLLGGHASTVGGSGCTMELPYSLGQVVGGGSTCQLFVCPDLMLGYSSGGTGVCGGSIQVPIPIASNTTRGASFYFQWAVLDPGAVGSPGVSVSQGIRVTP